MSMKLDLDLDVRRGRCLARGLTKSGACGDQRITTFCRGERRMDRPERSEKVCAICRTRLVHSEVGKGGRGWNGEINNNNHFLGRHLVARVDRPLGILPQPHWHHVDRCIESGVVAFSSLVAFRTIQCYDTAIAHFRS